MKTYIRVTVAEDSSWNNVPGKVYVFNRYRNTLTPGTSVLVYEKGIGYTSTFKVGKITKLPDGFTCVMEDVNQFKFIVPIKENGKYYEKKAEGKTGFHWQKPAQISGGEFRAILYRGTHFKHGGTRGPKKGFKTLRLNGKIETKNFNGEFRIKGIFNY